jgi:ribosomal protein S18 acetylase RimI-like enzyme
METTSGSFPPGHNPQVFSTSHRFLLENPSILEEKHLNFTYEAISPSDISELKLLQRELFPINYSDSLYNEIGTKIVSLGCFLSHPSYNLGEFPMLVGAILFRIQENTSTSNLRWSYMFSSTYSTYILTIGVITILRGRGIAKRLLNYCLEYSSLTSPYPLYISLHVAEYNDEAIPFYETFGFELSEKLENHYLIHDENFAAFLYIYYLPHCKRPIMTWENFSESTQQLLSLCKCFKTFKFFKDS